MDRLTFVKYEAIFIVLAVLASLAFRNIFYKAQEAGRDGILRTIGAGILVMMCVWGLIFLDLRLLPENISFHVLECIAIPVLLAAFPAGCALAVGLARLDVKRWHVPAVILLALAGALLEYYQSIAANSAMFVVLVLGLGSLTRLAIRLAPDHAAANSAKK